MSTDLFHVEILKKTATTVVVEVIDTHHEISAPETEAFFFAALYEPAQDTEHPLGQAGAGAREDDGCEGGRGPEGRGEGCWEEALTRARARYYTRAIARPDR
jgi:hypothetical protein